MDEVKMVVEGVYSAKAAMGLAKEYGVQLPIIEQVNAVLFDGVPRCFRVVAVSKPVGYSSRKRHHVF